MNKNGGREKGSELHRAIRLGFLFDTKPPQAYAYIRSGIKEMYMAMKKFTRYMAMKKFTREELERAYKELNEASLRIKKQPNTELPKGSIANAQFLLVALREKLPDDDELKRLQEVESSQDTFRVILNYCFSHLGM